MRFVRIGDVVFNAELLGGVHKLAGGSVKIHFVTGIPLIIDNKNAADGDRMFEQIAEALGLATIDAGNGQRVAGSAGGGGGR